LQWIPLLCPPDVPQRDAIEQHRELRGVELRTERALMKRGQFEAPLLEPLVEDDEAAAVPAENLHAVAPARDEDEEVTTVDVLAPAGAHDGGQAVDAVAQIDRLGGEKD